MKSRKSVEILIIIVVVLGALYSLSLFDFPLHLGGDTAHYLILAKSIRVYHAYRDLYLPGEPPHTQYPPLFPLMLVPFTFFKLHWEVILSKVFIYILYILSLLVFLKVTSRYFKDRIFVLFAVTIFALSYLPAKLSHAVLSETPYMLLTLLSFLFLLKWGEKGREVYFYVSLILAILAYYTRTVGITLVGAIFLNVLIKKEKKLILPAFIITLIGTMLWPIRNELVGGSATGYLNQLFAKSPWNPELGRLTFGQFLKRTLFYIKYYLTEGFGKLTVPYYYLGAWHRFMSPVIYLVEATLYIGLFLSFKDRRLRPVALYAVFYLLMTFTWSAKDERFLLPILPFMGIFFSVTLSNITKKMKKNSFLPVLGLLLIFFFIIDDVFVLKVANIGILVKRNTAWVKGEIVKAYTRHGALIDGYLWMKDNLPKSSIVVLRKPRLCYYFAGLKAVRYPFPVKPLQFREFLKKNKVTHAYINLGYKTMKQYLFPLVKQLEMEGRAKLVYEKNFPPPYFVYQLISPFI